MKHVGKVAICLASGLALQTGLPAVTADNAGNPYAGIVDRNVFALKPPPPPPVAPDPNVTSPQKIILTGIVKAFGKKRVFFKTPPTGKPGEKEASFMLSESERAGEIEVLEINEALGTIRVRNHGLEQALSLEKDGMKPPGSGAAAAPGGMPLAAGAFPAVPGAGVPNFGTPNMGVPGGAGTSPALTPVPTFGGGGAASVQRPLRIIPPQTARPQVQPQAMDPAEQAAVMELHRAATFDQVLRGEHPPLPPIPGVTPPHLMPPGSALPEGQ